LEEEAGERFRESNCGFAMLEEEEKEGLVKRLVSGSAG
jgi:hypothetical protein